MYVLLMSLMRAIVLLLVCLDSTGHGRRLRLADREWPCNLGYAALKSHDPAACWQLGVHSRTLPARQPASEGAGVPIAFSRGPARAAEFSMGLPKMRSFDKKIASLAGSGGVILIDAENVRGRTGFRITHAALLAAVAVWTNTHELQGRVVLVVDHATAEQGFYLRRHGIGVVFAGSSKKADDVLQRDVGYFSMEQRRKPVVVTADGTLQIRCKKQAANLRLADPSKFIESLLSAVNAVTLRPSSQPELPPSPLVEELRKIDQEYRRVRSWTRREELRLQREDILQRIALNKSDDAPANAIDLEFPESRFEAVLRPEEARALKAGVGALRKSKRGFNMGGKRELTWEREILAEHLRAEFLAADDIEGPAQLNRTEAAATGNTEPGDDTDDDDDSQPYSSPVQTYITYFNCRIDPQGSPSAWRAWETVGKGMMKIEKDPSNVIVSDQEGEWLDGVKVITMPTDDLQVSEGQGKRQIRILVVSDTHGLENTRTSLPEADILIHCGDFQVDGNVRNRKDCTRAFDRWLSKQKSTSGVKIVVKGNHDRGARFPISGATYVEAPTKMEVCGITIALMPFSKVQLRGQLPPCDVLVSHLPPKGVRDRCYNGDYGGSKYLSELVCQSPKKPLLWLCGHIHEGYGYEYVKFSSKAPHSTLVVNAANANEGRATVMCHPPIVIEYPSLIAESNARPLLNAHPLASAEVAVDIPKSEHRLLSVDLGLRTGLALYDGEGKLLRYAQYQTSDVDTLGSLAEAWLAGDVFCNDEAECDIRDCTAIREDGTLPRVLPVTHLAIEGGDSKLKDVWDAACCRAAKKQVEQRDSSKPPPLIQIMEVSPMAWRADFLNKKEQANSKTAKAAAEQIAQQVVAERGEAGAPSAEPLPLDAAEAVLIGYFALRRLGWVSGEPAVQRYVNGNIIVPRVPASRQSR